MSSLQRQGRLSLLVKKKMKTAVANGLGEEVRSLLKVINSHKYSVLSLLFCSARTAVEVKPLPVLYSFRSVSNVLKR